MKHWMNIGVLALAALLLAPSVWAQDARIALVDFERAVVESREGKRGQEQFNAKLEEKGAQIEAKQKEIEDIQTRLQTQERVLSEAVKADMARDIERKGTELTRLNEDAQRELDTLRQDLLRPVLEVAQQVVQAYALDKGYTIVIDLSAPESTIIFANQGNNITDEIIKLVDAQMPVTPPATPAAAPATGATTTPRPTTP